MTYIDIIPKDLKPLLEHYVNYEHWKNMIHVFNILTTHEFDIAFENFVELFVNSEALEKIFKIKINCKLKNVTESTFSLALDIDVEQPITKNILFNVLQIFCENGMRRYSYKGIEWCKTINDYLSKCGYEERLILIPINDSIIIKILKVTI